MLGFFLAIGFGSTGSLPINESFIYPLQTISHPDCKFEDFDTLSGKCLIQLPRIKQAKYSSYITDTLVRGVYSELRSSSYDDGWDQAGGHSGVDFRTSRGTPAVSIGDGIVVDAGRNVGYGNVVKIKYLTPTGDTIYAIYAHLDSMTVKTDQTVTKGQKIGEVGDSGLAYGVHLHYEIDTTTRRGKPLYPYLDCAEQDPYIQNNTDACVDLLHEHTDDPIVFHEKYYSTLVATTDPTVPTESHPAPETGTTEDVVEDTIDATDGAVTTDIESVLSDKSDQELQAIYDIIKKNIPDLDVGSLSADAQSFLDTYSIQIKHKLSPKTTVGNDVNVEFYIYNKATGKPYTGTLPVAINLVAANSNIRILPSTIDTVNSSNGRVVVRLRGAYAGASIVGFTIDNTIFYALPVLVE
ncbi:MAG: M23 family metallopeptidase [Candidatus Peribacteria bacterium]|nr:MAG: M23 family metallopeptidase [Candidatus Peribacteria bacterium]